MTGEAHYATAETLLNVSGEMRSEPQTTLIAAELVWGATVHACAAIAHRAGRRPSHPLQWRQMERLLAFAVADPTTLSALEDGMHVAQQRLHNHFYTGRLGGDELARYLQIGVEHVRSLLQIAQHP